MRVIFRTDASLQIGAGHVARCLTLADAMRERGCDRLFICREQRGDLFELIRERGHDVHPLPGASAPEQVATGAQADPPHAAWLGVSWQADARETRDALAQTPADWLVVDHYALDARWEREMRPVARRIMAIDDLADRTHDCDLLLDQNLVADLERRYDGRTPAHCGLMLGPEYAMLQPSYTELRDRVPPREGPVRRVLIFFGGADGDNLTGRALAAALAAGRGDLDIDVVVSRGSPHLQAVTEQAARHPKVRVHVGAPSLAPLMAKADVAIGAGGVTSWERCCLGLPALVITLADNQRPIADELHRRGLVRWLGHGDEVSGADIEAALGAILPQGFGLAASEHCRRTVDGRGVERVSGLLMLSSQTPLRARLARLDDEALILKWANDRAVRQNAFNTDPIDPAAHRAWFRRRLRDLDHCRLYVIETIEGLPVGQVRFELSADAWVIDYAVDARVRGRGIGKTLLRTAIVALRASTTEPRLLAQVKIANEPSLRVFEGLGFTAEERDGVVTYRC